MELDTMTAMIAVLGALVEQMTREQIETAATKIRALDATGSTAAFYAKVAAALDERAGQR